MSSGGLTRPRLPFPAWAGPAERLRYFLRDAIRAPSRHNAQPWLFDIDGDELAIHVDARRALKAADPSGREATIACGAALENLRLSAAHHGYDVHVITRAPRRGEPLAIARLGERRVARPEEEELFGHIAVRRTATVIGSEQVSPAVLAPLAHEMGADAMLRLVPRWLARPVAELVWEADGIQWGSARYRSEVAIWSRGRPRRAGDGTAPLDPARAHAPAGFLSRLLRRARGGHGRVEAERRIDQQTRTLLVLSTRDDGPAEWFAAGRAMQRLLLRATASGLSVSFLSQPIEVADCRRRLRRELGDPGLPQLLLRVGYGPSPRATPRRPVDLVLRTFSSDAGVEVEVDVSDLSARAG